MRADQFDLAVYRHPLRDEGARFAPMQEGVTISDIVRSADIDPRFLADVQVTISKGVNAYVVPMSEWSKVRPKPGSHVLVAPRVEGAVAGLLLSALLPSAASYVAGTLFSLTAGTFVYAAVYAAVTIVGSLLVNALIPPPSVPGAAKQDDPNFSITGSSNAENRYGVYPTVLGRHLMYPPKTARGYTEGEADDIHFRGRFTFGYGPVALETLKIGTTPITEFEGVSIELRNVDRTRTLQHMPELASIVTAWRSGSSTMWLYPDDIAEDGYSVLLEHEADPVQSGGAPIVRVTRDRAESASVDVTYQGLVKFDDNNQKQERSVSVRYRYRRVGYSTWISAGTETHTGKSTASLRFTKTINFSSTGEYEIEVTRMTPDTDDAQIRDVSYLTAIRSVQAGNLPSPSDVAEIAIRVKASEQLNGQIETLNAVVQQMAPVWTGYSWTAPQPVRHPAWIYARALMGPMLRNPIDADRIQLGDLRNWATQEPHWTCDAVIDQPATVAEVLDTICAAGRGRRTLRDLKYSVIRDGGAGPVVQQFSPRNSWGFAGTITFPKQIHGFRVRCLSERLEWQQDEFEVYADGYSASTATELETLELRGVVLDKGSTTQSNAWRLARYHLAQAILRPEEFSWLCDLEHLRVNMGDKVRLVHDVPKIGVGAGRITAINTRAGGYIDTLVLDELFMLAGSSYRMVARRQNGEMQEFSASPPVSFDGGWTVSSNVSAALFEMGDLVAIEELTQESMDVLITSIVHGEDLSATLTGVPAAPEVLNADSGTIPPYEPIITNVVPRTSLTPSRPEIISADVEARLSPVGIVGIVEWSVLDQFGVNYWNIYVTAPNGSRLYHSRATEPTATILMGVVGVWTVEVIAVGPGGVSFPASIELERTPEIEIPADVTGFRVDVVGAQAQLLWDAGDEFVSHYELRYLLPSSPVLHGWDESRVVSRPAGTTWALSGASIRYFIKAVSVFGKYSEYAAEVDTADFAPEPPVITDVTVQARFDPARVTAAVAWTSNEDDAAYNIEIIGPNGQRTRIGETTALSSEFSVPLVGAYTVEVTARGPGGFVSAAARQSFQRSVDVEIPADVTGFRVDVVGAQAQLLWDAGDEFVSHYELRYLLPSSPVLHGWDESRVVSRPAGTTWALSGASIRYFIKAVSVFGKYSEHAAEVDTADFAPEPPVITDVTVQARFDPARVTAAVAWTGNEDDAAYNIEIIGPNGQRTRIGETTALSSEFSVPLVGAYTVEVTARGPGGFVSAAARQSFQRSVNVEIPADVTGFRVDVSGAQAQLTWDAGGALISHYHIKHVPEGMAQEWPQALDVLTEVVGRTATVPALHGAYLIRAVSVFERTSATSSVVSSSTQFLDDYNVVEVVDEAPTFAGVRSEGLALVGGALETVSSARMSEWGSLSNLSSLRHAGGVATDAIYTFEAPIDLGEVYTSRVTAQVDASGYVTSNRLTEMPHLSQLTSLLGAAPESWSCELQVRTTNDDPAAVPFWSDWAAFRVGDYVARGIEFRCVFHSDDPNVVIRLSGAAVQVDMPDRTEAGADVVCPAAGVYVPFVPAFRVKPAINVTGQELPSGARSVRSNATASGFHQQFVDAGGNGLACSFDWQAKGYGRIQS